MENAAFSYQEYLENVGQGILTKNGNCPVTLLLLRIQGKWKAQILYQFCIHKKIRFGELKKSLPGITNTMLTNALRELVRDGLVLREQFNEIPPHVEYSFSEMGRDLLPVFYEMMVWGMKHEEDILSVVQGEKTGAISFPNGDGDGGRFSRPAD